MGKAMGYQFRKKNETIFGAGNSPMAGANVHYYIAGTTTRLDTYADQAGNTINDNPITLNADGDFPVSVYLGEANDYKEVIEAADSSFSTTIDNIPKDETPSTTLLVQSPSYVWTTVSALNTILDENDAGKAFAANTQNNNVTFLLPNPALTQNGPTLVFKKINASNNLILQDHLGGAYLTISNDGDSVLLSSNGAEWHVVSDLNSSQGGSIDDDEVTNTKLANVGSGTFKGRMTAGVGDPEDLGPADATSLLNEFSPDNDTNAPGVKGLVPAPAIGDASAGKILSAGGTWIDPPSGGSASLNPATGGLVGVNATADVNNRLSINSPASLFNHEGSDHQLKVNKNTNTDTASVLFQTNFSGRAEFGLTGDDDFHMKVSPDGSTFHEGIIIDKDTGEVSLPNSNFGNYEEGTWTPTLGTVNGGDLAGATSINPIYANYKKIGKLVFVECGFTVNGVSGTPFTQKSTISVSGLPFIPVDNSGNIDNGGLSGFVYRSIGSAIDSFLAGGCTTSGTMYMFVFYTGFSEANLTNEFHVTLTYTTDS